MNKTIWVVANWKSNKTVSDALHWVSVAGPQIPHNSSIKVVICPSFSLLSEVKKAIQVGGFPITVGSQDLSPFDVGSYTGEESASLLKQFIDLSILGHSERRNNFKEDDELILQKTERALEAGIKPLVCVQDTETVVPKGCRMVAYEPIFAIGTGNPDTPENASNVASKLKEKNGAELEVLYGGSVNLHNIKQFIEKENISGVLVGKASLDPQEFVQLIKECAGETD